MQASDQVIEIPAAVHIADAEEYQVSLDKVRWRYLRAGNSGPPLMLIHGLMGYSWSWRFNMQELGRHFTVFAPDLPGCGFSQRADSVTGSLEGDAEGLIKFVDHLGIEEFDLFGTSRGGAVAVILAAQLARRGMRQRIRRIILSAPVNPWSKFGNFRVRMLAKGLGRLWTIHLAKHMPFLLQYYFRRLYADVSRIAPGSVEGYEAGLEPPRSMHHLASILREWFTGLTQVEAALPSLQDLPILLLWGDRDTAVYPSSAYELHSRLSNSTVLMMPGVGHLPYEELPADFNRVVCDFLLRHEPRTPLDVDVSGPASIAKADAPAYSEQQVDIAR
jgi:pimeloyl-ACP methyl ester carboxylesterase